MAKRAVLSDGGELVTDDGVPIPTSALGGDIVTGSGVGDIVSITAAAYTALDPPDAATLYVETETPAIYLGETAIYVGP